jgi:hypothetical protein
MSCCGASLRSAQPTYQQYCYLVLRLRCLDGGAALGSGGGGPIGNASVGLIAGTRLTSD